MGNPLQNNPFQEVDERAIKYPSPEALKIMANNFDRRASREYDLEQIAKNRRTMATMAREIGDKDLLRILRNTFDENGERTGGLSDNAMEALWFHPEFMNGLGLAYEQAMVLAGKRKHNMSEEQMQVFTGGIGPETDKAIEMIADVIQQDMQERAAYVAQRRKEGKPVRLEPMAAKALKRRKSRNKKR